MLQHHSNLFKTGILVFTIFIFNHSLLFSAGKPDIQHITTEDGLIHNTVRHMIQDKTGYLWFGTLSGLNRYDGVKFNNFLPDVENPNSLSSGKIKILYPDSHGHLWVRTYGNIFHCYDPEIENFIPVFSNPADAKIKYNSFYEDKHGNVWLGTVDNGCIQISFNDKKISNKVFSSKKRDFSLPSDNVRSIFEDSHQNIWITTNNGIVRFFNDNVEFLNSGKGRDNVISKSFELNKQIYFISQSGKVFTYISNKNKIAFVKAINSTASIIQAAQMGKNKMIISTYNHGTFIFDAIKNQIESAERLFGNNLFGNTDFEVKPNGDLLAFNFSGNAWIWINKLNKIVHLNLIPPAILQLIDEERYQFLTDRHNNIWISTYGNGLFSYNIVTGKTEHFTTTNNQSDIASDYLLALELDKNDNIWVGTENMGVNKLSFFNRDVNIIYPDADKNLRNANFIRALMEDKQKNIWVSTRAGNLYKFDQSFTKKTTIIENSFSVYDIFEDNKGTVYLGTKKDGIIELPGGNPQKMIVYKHSANTNSISHNTVFSVLKDRKGRLWSATFGGGVNVKINTGGTESFRTFFIDDEWIKFVRIIFEDNSGIIWIGTTNGIIRFNPDELLKNASAYKYYTFSPLDENGLSNPEVRYFFQDSKGKIWLATTGGGINSFEGETKDGKGIFKIYNHKNGLANDNIMAIQEDTDGNLWFSTENGMQKLNRQNNSIQYFRFSDDLSSNIFSETTGLLTSNGKMIWGTLNGFYVFDPKSFNSVVKKSNKVVLTGLTIYDQAAKIAEKNAPLKKSISFSERVDLKAADKVFHIEFSNLNFRDPKANQFMYMLENYEKRWNYSGTDNMATYRNVPAGRYTFMVKGINEQGEWDDEVTQIKIVIHPPFWKSNIAFLIYAILVTAAFYFVFRLITKFNDLNNAVKVERQLTDYKLRFFTNISHEFRTPLTLIKGSVDTLTEWKDNMSEPLKKITTEIDRNTSHLLRLIDQLLEFRKLQNNKQKLHLQKSNMDEFLGEIFKSFENVAEKTNIDYKYIHSNEINQIYIDRNKVDKIVFNLLSNAFKFTPRGGKITLTTESDLHNEIFRISVADNGIGIPQEKQNLLFSRFMQINFSQSGTGIGLSLVNEFTNLHHGKAYFNENTGGGSVFTIELPLNEKVYMTDDFVEEQTITIDKDENKSYKMIDFIKHEDLDVSMNWLPNSPLHGQKYKILVIDDNDDIRDFLTEKLSVYYDVITAEDGEKGIVSSMENDPDLIICDVMMPGMNGFDLTKRIKDDFATCHIPVILLTAYMADEHNTEGIEAGAEAYISKPFSLKHLLLQINKLLEKRENLHKHFANNYQVFKNQETANDNQSTNQEVENEDFPTGEKLGISDRDQQFLAFVYDILEKNITNPNFSVNDFASIANTGRTLFFKKIKYLTGYSPNEMIRARRMMKAAELLKTYKYNISEVSYMVGIYDPFYFSKCFKAHFGCSPTQYLNN